MLTFDLRSLEFKAAAVDDQLPADDPVWQEDDPRPDTSVSVKGRLSATGSGQFYWHGHISGDVTAPCRRCLVEAHAHVEDESHIIYAEPNLRPAIREEWLLAQPRYVLCREDCKGLCPRCGKDLNEGPCDCPPRTDSRWESLRKAERA
jgi:uncharacterized protein